MAKVAAHIKEARKHGTQAGFDTWYEYLQTVTDGGTKGLPQVRDLLAEVNAAGRIKKNGEFRNPAKALDFYCAKYGLTDLPTTKTARSTRKAATPAAPAPQAAPDMQELFAQFMQSIQGGVAAEVKDDEDDTEVVNSVRTRRVARPSRNVEVEGDTGTAVYPPPRDPDAEATQGKLWKLNHDGPANGIYLAVIDGDGNILAGGDDRITAGEAYDLIGEYIA